MILKGVSHIHSTYSFDGQLPLPTLVRYFEEKGFDFVLMSEHVESLNVDSLRSFIADCRRLTTSRLLIVPGVEIEHLNLLVFGIKSVHVYSDMIDLIEQFRSQGTLLILSHPAKLHSGALEVVSDIIEGVEVWNNKYDGKLAPRAKSLKLFERLRDSNPGLVPVCGQDFHGKSDYANVWMEVPTIDRSEEAIIAAIRSGNVRLTAGGQRIPIYNDSSFAARTLYFLKIMLSTVAVDSLFSANLCLRKLGIRAPRCVRTALRKFF